MFVTSFTCHQRLHVLVGQWCDWQNSAIALAAVSGRSVAGPAGPRVSRMFLPHVKNFIPMKFMLVAGGHRQQNTNFLDCILIGIFHWEKMSSILTGVKMADTWKDGLLLGGGIRHITATPYFMRRSKQVPACVRNIV